MVTVGESCRNLVQCCEVNRCIVCAKTEPVTDVISLHLVRILDARRPDTLEDGTVVVVWYPTQFSIIKLEIPAIAVLTRQFWEVGP